MTSVAATLSNPVHLENHTAMVASGIAMAVLCACLPPMTAITGSELLCHQAVKDARRPIGTSPLPGVPAFHGQKAFEISAIRFRLLPQKARLLPRGQAQSAQNKPMPGRAGNDLTDGPQGYSPALPKS